MKRFLILYLTLTFGLLSCVDEYDAELPVSEQRLLVVEGCIVSEETCEFDLTTTVPINDTHADYEVTDATLSVHGSDGSVWPCSRRVGCRYYVQVGQLRDDVQYWLQITRQDGTAYSSEPALPTKAPEIQLSTYVQTNVPNPRVEIRLGTIGSHPGLHLRLSFQQWWEIWTPLESPYVTESVWLDGSPVQYTMHHGYGAAHNGVDQFVHTQEFQDSHVRNYTVFSLPVTSPKLSTLFCTQISCQAVSEAEFRYEEARRKQSDEMGGLFTPQPGNLPSNIRCTTNSQWRALGYVGVRGTVSRQRHWVRPEEVDWQEIRKGEQQNVAAGSDDDIRLSHNPAYRLFYVDELAAENIWVSRWLVDYTDPSWGGNTRFAPDFWDEAI